jgi:hypothetical protein
MYQYRHLLHSVLCLSLVASPLAWSEETGHSSHDAAPAAAENASAHASMGHEHGGMGQSRQWTALPILKTRMSGESRQDRVVTVVPRNIVANSIFASSNNLHDKNGVRALPLEMAGARMDKPETGGFHWLFAREDDGADVHIASTVYNFGERGADNPTAMFMVKKNELEIIPQPYPREHSRYRAGEQWKFLVRFNGQPLAAQKVVVETSNGTRTEAVSDATGVVTVQVPDDFKEVATQKPAEAGKPQEHNHNMGASKSADIVLATEIQAADKHYLTAFNSSYGPNPYDGRNLVLGLGFAIFGMLGATPLLRQRKTVLRKTAASAAPASQEV